MLFNIAGLAVLAGFMCIVSSSKESYNIRRIKGVQKPGETDQHYEQRLRARLKRNGQLILLCGVVLLTVATLLEVLPET